MITIGGQLDILAQRLRDIGSKYLDLPIKMREAETHTLFLDSIKTFEVISG